MESATTLTPPSGGFKRYNDFYKILPFFKDQNSKKNIDILSKNWEILLQQHTAQRQLLRPLNILGKRIVQK